MAEDAPSILMIEDEPQMRRFLRVMLTSHGYRPLEADTAAQGLAQAAMRAPDVVRFCPDRFCRGPT